MEEKLTWRERQRQLREDAVLDTAHDLLIEQGYADMSMDELAARVGISKATLYQHFASKDELAIHVIVRMMRRGEQTMHAIDPTLPAMDRIEQIIRRGFERKAGLATARLTLLPNHLHSHPLYIAQSARMHAMLIDLVEQARADGSLAPGLTTTVVARILLRFFQIDFADLLAAGSCTQAELVDTAARMLFDGLRARTPYS